MKRTITAIELILLGLLCSCSEDPSSFVGRWKSEEKGLFGANIVIVLKSDGRAEVSAGIGPFSETAGLLRWKKEGKKLFLEGPDGTVEVYTILGKTETTLTLQKANGEG